MSKILKTRKFIFVYKRVSICVCMGAHSGQKRVSENQELQLQAGVSHLVR